MISRVPLAQSLPDYASFMAMCDYCWENRREYYCPIPSGTNMPPRGRIFALTSAWLRAVTAMDHLPGPFVLVTHQEEVQVTDAMAAQLPANVVRWYAQNCAGTHPKLVPIPCGGARRDLIGPGWYETLQRGRWFPKRPGAKRVFVCHSPSYNLPSREAAYQVLADKPYVTARRVEFTHYTQLMREHEFVICPPGGADDGCDCLRTCEALYLETVPIFLDRPVYRNLAKLFPAGLVSRWEDVTPAYLDDLAVRTKDVEVEAIGIDYWKARVTL